MTATPQPGEVRVSPDSGDEIAWFRPEDGDPDFRPWLVLVCTGDANIEPDLDWMPPSYVDGWRVIGHSVPPERQP